MLLNTGADVKIKDNNGWTPLHAASSNGHLEVVKLLLDNRSDIIVANEGGWTPLHVVSFNGDVKLARLFLQVCQDQANFKDTSSRTALFYTAMRGRSEIMRLLLFNKASANVKDRYNATPLITASRNGHGSTVKLLIEAENHVFNCKDDLRLTTLCWARKNGNIETIQLLLRHSGGMEPEASGEDASSGESIPKFDSSLRWCDVCTIYIPHGKACRRCEICNEGNFLICLDCCSIGIRCYSDSHK